MFFILQILRQLEVGNRVGSDQVFEAEQVSQKMFAHDQIGPSGIGSANVVENALTDLQQKGAGAAGKIEHRNAAMVREALRNAEAAF